MDRVRSGARSGRLLERARELDLIDAAVQAALAAEGRALLIEGPAGIGKTALLEAASARAQQRGLIVLSARGGELEQHFPYGVARQLFEPALRRASTARRGNLLSGAAGLAGPILAAGDGGDSDADTEFARIHGLYWLTVNLCQGSPLALVVDDAQWSDQSSLRFLLYLARRLDGLGVALLVASRDGDWAGRAPLAAELGREPSLHALAPAALSAAGVGELLAEELPRPAPEPEFVGACHDTTGGVPFLVHELVAALVADGIEPSASQAQRVRDLGPRAIGRATLARLGRMSDDCVALAKAIAVLGGEAQLPRAAKLAGLGELAALAALDALIAAAIVRTAARLEYVHPILRAAIYDELPPGERSRLHRGAARLLMDEGAQLDAIAAQLMASEPVGSEEVVASLRKAARQALREGAPETAVAYLSRALAEGGERERRALVSFELAGAAKLAGLSAVIIERYRDARRLSEDPVLRSRAALELAMMLTYTGDWEGPIALVEEALAELGDRAPELALRLEILRAGSAAQDPRLVAEFDRRLPALRALPQRAGAGGRTVALLLAAISAWRRENPDAVTALVRYGWDSGAVLAAGRDPWAPWQGIVALVFGEELDLAQEMADVLLADAQARGSLFAFMMYNAYRGWIEGRRGHLSQAEAGLRDALEGERLHQLNWELAWHLWFATDVIVERPEAADLAALARSVDPGSRQAVHSGAMMLDVRARARQAAGDVAGAIDDLSRAGEIFRALGHRNPNATNWRSTLALMLGPDRRADALELVREERSDASMVGIARGIGVATRALGLLSGGAEGRELLERAVAVLDGSPARLEHARALVELGAAMRRAGERSAARDPLRAGLDLASECGATRLSERARTELAAAGARPRRLRATGRDSLTPSELRVARLAAEGHTNNAVAQALFVTPKTVDTHLSHIYAKLDVSSRRALAGALGLPGGDAAAGDRSVRV